jgi:threonine dehydratase
MKLHIDDIREAQIRIAPYIQRTQTCLSRSISSMLGTQTYLKYENEQRTGSFKIRGAMNKISRLSQEELKKGIIACSAGNHAQGVAFSATAVGSKARIVMPESSPIVKVMATQGYGAEVILHGEIFDESYNRAKELEKENGYTFVHPFHDKDVMAGQGTIALEILEQIENLDSVVIPIGGGGLIAGMATVFKTINPKIKIYGVVPQNNPGMYLAFKGQPAESEKRLPTLADGLAVKQPNQEIFNDFIKPLVDDIAIVDEDEIASSIVFLLERAKTVAEGASATSLAAALKMKSQWSLGKNCCLLLCGGNIDLNMISKVIERGFSKVGRVARVKLIVQDQPGALQNLTTILAKEKANIIQVYHDRLAMGIAMNETQIEFLLECRGQPHVDQVLKALKDSGARIQA